MALVPEATLAEVLAASRAAWPAIVLDADAFAAYLAARVPEAELGNVRAADLYLACAIGAGDPAALAAFDTMLDVIDPAIAHLDGGSALADDVRAKVRERVLAHGGKAKIAEYRGRGDLRGWLRIVALREALQLVRARRREAPIASPGSAGARSAAKRRGVSIEPDLVRELEAGTAAMTADELRIYREAFAAALSTLAPRERNLLRQHYLHGATIDELGALYGVHRATAARWIAQIRETLLARTRRHVGEALRLTGTELDSAMGKLASHLDYSLRHTLSNEP